MRDKKKEKFVKELVNTIMGGQYYGRIKIEKSKHGCHWCVDKGNGFFVLHYTDDSLRKSSQKYVKDFDIISVPKNSFITKGCLFSVLHELGHIIQMSEDENNYYKMLHTLDLWRLRIKNKKTYEKTYRNLEHEAFADSKAIHLYKKYRRYINYLILKIENEKCQDCDLWGKIQKSEDLWSTSEKTKVEFKIGKATESKLEFIVER